MTEAQPDPITHPNSALAGPPFLTQLHLVNAGLEKNSHPRSHYSRQSSVTPERQTPESQRTPVITWPDIDVQEELQELKSWAADQAKLLESFYPGRMLLRKEEPERYGIFGENPEYWESQIAHWKREHDLLVKEHDRRKRLEAEGRATEGYAQALLLSPVQSPSPAPSDGILQATAAGIKKDKPAARRPYQQHATRSPAQHDEKRSSRLSQPTTAGESPQSTAEASKRRKDAETQKKRDVEGEGLAPMNVEVTENRSEPVTKSASKSRKNTSKVSKTATRTARTPKSMRSTVPKAPRALPWTLRSKDTISYRETGTRAVSAKKRRLRRGKAFEEVRRFFFFQAEDGIRYCEHALRG